MTLYFSRLNSDLCQKNSHLIPVFSDNLFAKKTSKQINIIEEDFRSQINSLL